MHNWKVRLRCLKIAAELSFNDDPERIIEIAKKFASYVAHDALPIPYTSGFGSGENAEFEDMHADREIISD